MPCACAAQVVAPVQPLDAIEVDEYLADGGRCVCRLRPHEAGRGLAADGDENESWPGLGDAEVAGIEYLPCDGVPGPGEIGDEGGAIV